MPLPLIVPGVLAAGSIIAGLVEAGSAIATIAAVAFTVYRIYVLLTLLWAAFWLVCAMFAKEMLMWWVDLYFWLVQAALDMVGMGDSLTKFAELVNGLPVVLRVALSWIGTFDSMAAMLTALFANFALRSLPLVGGLFRG